MNKVANSPNFAVSLLFLLDSQFLGFLLAPLEVGFLFHQIICVFLVLFQDYVSFLSSNRGYNRWII